jgi:hypothetical protein
MERDGVGGEVEPGDVRGEGLRIGEDRGLAGAPLALV